MISSDLLFVSPDLAVRRVGAGDGRRIVVTFDSYHDAPGTDRPGFGEAFFHAQGIAAIHVLTRGNDWFQYPELPDALAAIKATTGGVDRVMSYGASMGGYAAVRFADAVGADVALALSPQYSVDPRRSRFDRRWRQDRRRIHFLRALEGPLRGVARTILAYDPLIAEDRRHVDAIAAEAPVDRLPLPCAGHALGAFLVETRLLTALVLDTLDGRLDLAAIAREARARRGLSPTFLGELSARQPRWRDGTAIALAERAVALEPAHAAAIDRLALRLRDAGDFDRAIAAHERAIALDPVHNYLWSLGKTLERAGAARAALTVADRLHAAAPTIAGYRAWAATLRRDLHDPDGALTDMRAALLLAPTHLGYRAQIVRMIIAARLAAVWRRATR